MRGDGVVRRQQHGLLKHVAQLAYVARPGVTEQQLFGLITEMQMRFAIALAMTGEEVPGQQQDVFATRVQTRDLDRNDAQPEEQIPPEFTLLHHLLKVAVGRADHPQIDLALLHRTHAANGAIFQQLQELGLQQQVHFADFIEKQRAAVRRFHQTDPPILGVGERAFFMTE